MDDKTRNIGEFQLFLGWYLIVYKNIENWSETAESRRKRNTKVHAVPVSITLLSISRCYARPRSVRMRATTNHAFSSQTGLQAEMNAARQENWCKNGTRHQEILL